MNAANDNNRKYALDLGNNGSISRGVFKNIDGTFTAITYGQSKEFRTERGAWTWFNRKMGIET